MSAPGAGPGRIVTGLTQAEAALRLRRAGSNILPAPRGPSPVRVFLRQLTHFFALMLWVAAVLAALAGMPALGAAIAVVVVLNGLFAFAQEWRADRAGQKLAALLPVRATVLRDGRRLTVPAEELVVGDVVLLAGGDRVSADIALTQAAGLTVDESTLTGESVPAPRRGGEHVAAGTFVVEGEGEGLVEATGGNTRLAAIAALTQSEHRPVSPLTQGLNEVVRRIAAVAVVAGVVFFAVSLALGSSASDGFVLALGVTVALVPEGLLPTVTLSLARAAQRMSSQHALVRRLEAVETLGSTTFVCTDKTGTLTCNEMSAVRVWTPQGEVRVHGGGYSPAGRLVGPPAARAAVAQAAVVATLCSNGRVRRIGEQWMPSGDPMEVALHVLALRADADVEAETAARPMVARYPFDPRRRRMSVVTTTEVLVKGAPDTVLPRCVDCPTGATEAATALARRGLRVLAVASRPLVPVGPPGLPASADEAESALTLLALDIGTDLLPALALGGEPPSPRVLDGPVRTRTLIDAALMRRAFGVLGGTEALVEMFGFLVVLTMGGWVWAGEVDPTVMRAASGAAFATVVLAQLANAFACRSQTRWAGAVDLRTNPLLLSAVAVEVGLLAAFLWVPPLAALLGGTPPPAWGWAVAVTAVPAVIAADAAHKWSRARSRSRRPRRQQAQPG